MSESNAVGLYSIVGIYLWQSVLSQGTYRSSISIWLNLMIDSRSSLMLGVWLFFFPESPKFLIECGETEEALDILRDMYEENTGQDRLEYPVNCHESTHFRTNILYFSLFLFFVDPVSDRLKVYANVKASVRYPDARVNRCERWACGNRKKWKCCWTKYGRRRNYYVKHLIYGTRYWHVLSSSVWQQGQCQRTDINCLFFFLPIFIDFHCDMPTLVHCQPLHSSLCVCVRHIWGRSVFQNGTLSLIFRSFSFHFQLLHANDLVSRAILSIWRIREWAPGPRGVRLWRIVGECE